MSEQPREDRQPALRVIVVPVTLFQQNCSILWCAQTKKAAVVDPGGEIERILAVAQKEKLTIERIWVTHGHADHVGGVAELAERLSVPIEGPEAHDQFWIERLVADSASFGLGKTRSFVPDRWLGDGDTVSIGSVNFDVIHCPGHTPGHVVFYNEAARFAAVGDVLFRGSIGRTDFPRGDHAALIGSIRHKLFPLGDDITFLPGHGPLSTFGEERMSNPFVSDEAVGA